MSVSREKVQELLSLLANLLPAKVRHLTGRIKVTPVLKASLVEDGKLEVLPLLRIHHPDDSTSIVDPGDLNHLQYGNQVYLQNFGLVTLDNSPNKLELPVKRRTVLEGEKIPEFLQAHREALQKEIYLIDPEVKSLKIYDQALNMSCFAHAIERDWYWLSFDYTMGKGNVSLLEIIKNRENGKRYLNVQDGWVDCDSPRVRDFLQRVEEIPNLKVNAEEKLKISLLQLFRIAAAATGPLKVQGKAKEAAELKRILKLKPAGALPSLK
ncbi:MAG: hypothetical protein FVQ80_18205, partial [Planctomycetes bacterium]|nr:hypothetical protein [Planctomycetota bacterium]